MQAVPCSPELPNWLDHKQGAAYIDAMLLVGATMEQLKAGTRKSVPKHLRHLELEHGLPVVSVRGVYRFREPEAQ